MTEAGLLPSRYPNIKKCINEIKVSLVFNVFCGASSAWPNVDRMSSRSGS
jgi:hypothetical protein